MIPELWRAARRPEQDQMSGGQPGDFLEQDKHSGSAAPPAGEGLTALLAAALSTAPSAVEISTSPPAVVILTCYPGCGDLGHVLSCIWEDLCGGRAWDAVDSVRVCH